MRMTNLARLDLVSMKLLLECAACGSLSAAAGRCHLSVMGASYRLRRLEEALGKPLFHRHRHGLAPTQAGRAAVEHARQVLGRVDQLIASVAGAGDSERLHGENCGRRGRSPGRATQDCGAAVFQRRPA